MQKQRSSHIWLIVILCILLPGLTVWSLTALFGDRFQAKAPTFLESNRAVQTTYSELPSARFNTLIVGGDDSNPPYSYMEDGIALGLDNDLMRAVAKDLGMNIEFKLSSLSEAKKNLKNGNIDVIGGVSSLYYQDQDFLFGTPHAVQYYELFVRKNEGIESVADLQDKTLILLKGDSVEDQLSDEGALVGQIVYAQSSLEAATWLSSGKYDAALLTRFQGYYLIKEHNLDNLKNVGKSLKESNYGFAVSKENRSLLLKINQALGVIENNGVKDDLFSKWLSTYQQANFFDTNEIFIYIVIFISAVSFIILVWGWSLQRLVKKRTHELKSSEEKYRQLINNASEGVVIVANKEIVYFNPQSAAIIGLEKNTFDKAKSILNYIHPLDHELVLIKYNQLLEGPPVNIQFSIRLVKISGETIWIKSNAIKIEWEKSPALLIFFTDTTEEKKLQESIKNSEERYRLIFAQSPVGLFYFDTDLRITNVNARFAEIMGAKPEDFINYDLKSISNERFLKTLNQIVSQENGFFEGWVNTFKSSEERKVYVKLRTAPLISAPMEYQGGIGLLEDLTEQVHTENKIQNLEDRFSKAFLTSTDAITIVKLKTGVIIDVNQGFVDLSGYSREDAIGKTTAELDIWVDKKDIQKLLDTIKKSASCRNQEVLVRNKDGSTHYALMSSSIIEIDGERCLLSISRIIDEIKKNEQIIRESEHRYRSIFESVPVSIWEQDLVDVYDMLAELRESGVDDLQKYMNKHPDFVEAAVKTIKIIDVNDASLKIYKAHSREELFISLDKIFNHESLDNFKKELIAIWNQESLFTGDSVNLDLQGNRIFVNVAISIPKERDEFKNVLVSITDISQRKQTEDALLESESRYRQLVEQVNVVVYLDYASLPSRTKYISPQIESLLGFTQDEWMTDPDLKIKIIHPDDVQRVIDTDNETDASGTPYIVEYRAFAKDGSMIWIHDEAVLVCDSEGKPDDWHGVMYDVTARKMAEQALRESEIRYRTIFNTVPLSIKQEDFSGLFKMFEELRQSGITSLEDYLQSHPEWIKLAAKEVHITEVNQESLLIYKADRKEQLLLSLDKCLTEESYASFQKEILAFWNHQTSFVQETVNTTMTGETIDVWVSITIPSQQEDYSKVLVTILDITERKRTEEQIRVQVRYLAALHAVDMAISASMDLPITLRVLLNQVHQQLLVDAVSILILDPHTQTLKYSAGIGFKTNAIESTNLRLGQSYAGQAALERRTVTSDSLNSKTSLIHTKEFDQEEFTHYIGVPLIAKGTVKGVLELFNRNNPFSDESSWMVLLESLAGQAAIAIENATLMDEVQKINMNLRSAYDATVEGWARSLDLRNGDTEDHSKRVADLAVGLAQAAGYHGEGLLTIRRGALLHDIGKLAIPEKILLKPGPLTDKEWEVMKTHPMVAKRMLNSIEFLQTALDIPYSHHERWDGSGYPEGLKGEEIPFSARVFAIVDCWEALRSDRPWRKAWTDGNALDFIENNAGKAFDPQIVDKFKQLIGHNFSTYF